MNKYKKYLGILNTLDAIQRRAIRLIGDPALTDTLDPLAYRSLGHFSAISLFTLSNAKHGGKYWNRSRGKLDFEGSSGKDYGTHGLN